MNISVMGLGKLGLPLAVVHASKGFNVIGLDTNQDTVDAIQLGQCPVCEPGLAQLLFRARKKLTVTTDYEEAVMGSDISFIIVPTPSDHHGRFSNDYILAALKGMAPALANKKNYHLVVITSTVMPGTTDRIIKPAIEKMTAKKCGVHFGLCYSPEFIALGDVINGMLNPDAVLIGESNKHDGNMLEDVYSKVCWGSPVKRMSWWNAEIAKISLNVFITAKMSLANIFAEACEMVPTGNADDVTGFLGLDSRIGSKYLKGAVSFGGACFPRDNRAFIAFAKEFNIDCPIQRSVDDFNKVHSDHVVNRALSLMKHPYNTTVSVLGLTYKPDTNVVTESASLDIVRSLCQSGLEVNVYDPQGMENAKQALEGLNVFYAKSISSCLTGSDLCIIATPWKEFRKLGVTQFAMMRNRVVFDCWRIIDNRDGIDYHALGVEG